MKIIFVFRVALIAALAFRFFPSVAFAQTATLTYSLDNFAGNLLQDTVTTLGVSGAQVADQQINVDYSHEARALCLSGNTNFSIISTISLTFESVPNSSGVRSSQSVTLSRLAISPRTNLGQCQSRSAFGNGPYTARLRDVVTSFPVNQLGRIIVTIRTQQTGFGGSARIRLNGELSVGSSRPTTFVLVDDLRLTQAVFESDINGNGRFDLVKDRMTAALVNIFIADFNAARQAGAVRFDTFIDQNLYQQEFIDFGRFNPGQSALFEAYLKSLSPIKNVRVLTNADANRADLSDTEKAVAASLAPTAMLLRDLTFAFVANQSATNSHLFTVQFDPTLVLRDNTSLDKLDIDFEVISVAKLSLLFLNLIPSGCLNCIVQPDVNAQLQRDSKAAFDKLYPVRSDSTEILNASAQLTNNVNRPVTLNRPSNAFCNPGKSIEFNLAIMEDLAAAWRRADFSSATNRVVALVTNDYWSHRGLQPRGGIVLSDTSPYVALVTAGFEPGADRRTDEVQAVLHEVGHTFGLNLTKEAYQVRKPGTVDECVVEDSSVEWFSLPVQSQRTSERGFMGSNDVIVGAGPFPEFGVAEDSWRAIFKKLSNDGLDPNLLQVSGILRKTPLEFTKIEFIEKTGFPAPPVDGDYSLEFLDKNNAIVEKVGFAVNFSAFLADIGPIEVPETLVAFAVEIPTDAISARIRAPDNRVLFSQQVTNRTLPGDLDNDGDVDSADLAIMNAARNQSATGPDDPRDLDDDGKITALDSRKLTTLCTRPRCATQ